MPKETALSIVKALVDAENKWIRGPLSVKHEDATHEAMQRARRFLRPKKGKRRG